MSGLPPEVIAGLNDAARQHTKVVSKPGLPIPAAFLKFGDFISNNWEGLMQIWAIVQSFKGSPSLADFFKAGYEHAGGHTSPPHTATTAD